MFHESRRVIWAIVINDDNGRGDRRRYGFANQRDKIKNASGFIVGRNDNAQMHTELFLFRQFALKVVYPSDGDGIFFIEEAEIHGDKTGKHQHLAGFA